MAERAVAGVASSKAGVRNRVLMLGYGNPDDEIIGLAHRFTDLRFVGVDSEGEGVTRQDLPENLELVRGDMKSQLEAEDPGSLDMISSKLAFGYYTDYGREVTFRYSQEVSDLAFSRLKPGKRFHIIAGAGLKDPISGCLSKSGFSVTVGRQANPSDGFDLLELETAWMRAMKDSGGKLVLITGEKPA
ncbi:MAG: hypothetical protein GF416_09355 [Candidatus Altiarchaeales archaeon]|nr:hypothetical protein [Candidatus Altiarchaeales archaeon]MBD3417326.1 hypothetical protein [Candidatus Altiarchaeales archaeon]